MRWLRLAPLLILAVFFVPAAYADDPVITEPTDLWFEYTEPTTFYVRTFDAPGYWSDPMLWLYDSAGQLLAANDDWYGLQSRIEIPVTPGLYRLRAGVCCWDPNAWRPGYRYTVSTTGIPIQTTTTSSTTTTEVVPTTTTTLPPETVLDTTTSTQSTTTTIEQTTTTATVEPSTTTTEVIWTTTTQTPVAPTTVTTAETSVPTTVPTTVPETTTSVSTTTSTTSIPRTTLEEIRATSTSSSSTSTTSTTTTTLLLEDLPSSTTTQPPVLTAEQIAKQVVTKRKVKVGPVSLNLVVTKGQQTTVIAAVVVTTILNGALSTVTASTRRSR